MATYKALAVELGISAPTAKARVDKLIHAINPDAQESKGTLVSADLKHSALGMELIDVLLDASSYRNMQQLEAIITEHPYSTYRIRRFGASKGLYAQFRIPYSANAALIDLLTLLREEEIIKQFFLLRSTAVALRTNPTLAAWQPQTLSWHFDWPAWREAFDSSSNELAASVFERPNNSLLNRLQPIDIGIMALLTENARRKRTYMRNRLPRIIDHPDAENVSIRTFNRRYQFVRDNLIASYRVHLDWRVFDIHYTVLFVGEASQKLTGQFYNHLSSEVFPFTSLFKLIGRNTFFWFVQTTPAHFSSLVAFLWEICDKLDVHVLDYASSLAYYFWPKTWNFELGSWEVSHDFLLTEPLERAKITFSPSPQERDGVIEKGRAA